jgi:non-heme chloroperoxidase
MTTVAQTTTTHTVRGGGGLRLHVPEWGKTEGPPILLIHGLPRTQAQPAF